MKKNLLYLATALAIMVALGLPMHRVQAASTFPDIPQDAWYSTSVAKAEAYGIVSGYADGQFHPQDAVTRSQFVQILYNRYGNGFSGTNSGFRDVDPAAWYATAVTWASEAGLVNGVGNRQFAPREELTREQLAVILYGAVGRPAVSANKQLSKYLDYKDVSSWARDGMAWCVSKGVLQGTTATSLDPGKTTTRAEAATIIVRYIECEK